MNLLYLTPKLCCSSGVGIDSMRLSGDVKNGLALPPQVVSKSLRLRIIFIITPHNHQQPYK